MFIYFKLQESSVIGSFCVRPEAQYIFIRLLLFYYIGLHINKYTILT